MIYTLQIHRKERQTDRLCLFISYSNIFCVIITTHSLTSKPVAKYHPNVKTLFCLPSTEIHVI